MTSAAIIIGSVLGYVLLGTLVAVPVVRRFCGPAYSTLYGGKEPRDKRVKYALETGDWKVESSFTLTGIILGWPCWVLAAATVGVFVYPVKLTGIAFRYLYQARHPQKELAP